MKFLYFRSIIIIKKNMNYKKQIITRNAFPIRKANSKSLNLQQKYLYNLFKMSSFNEHNKNETKIDLMSVDEVEKLFDEMDKINK